MHLEWHWQHGDTPFVPCGMSLTLPSLFLQTRNVSSLLHDISQQISTYFYSYFTFKPTPTSFTFTALASAILAFKSVQ